MFALLWKKEKNSLIEGFHRILPAIAARLLLVGVNRSIFVESHVHIMSTDEFNTNDSNSIFSVYNLGRVRRINFI